MKRILHKALSMLLTVAMVLNMGAIPVFAEGASLGVQCHAAHDGDCGYSETIKMDGCIYEHDGDTDDTEHQHDENCGYSETITITAPCTHTCEVCKVVDSSKPQEEICTCEPSIGEDEASHGQDCPLYTAPELSEAVKALIAMVDALPNGADITAENKEATILDYEGAVETYEALSHEDNGVFEATEQYTNLMALTAIMTKSGTAPVVSECICPRGGSSRIHIDNCPLYGLEFQVSNARMAEAGTEGITVEKTGDFTWDIFANGNPIIVAQEYRNTEYSDIYIDKNGNGTVDEDEKPLVLPDVYEDPKFGFGYFLKNSRIYGGSKTADVAGDTSVTLDGGIVWQIFGGNHSAGTVTGDTHVTIKDGNVQYAYGGGAGYSDSDATYVTGTTYVTLSGGTLAGNLYGGGGWRGATVGNSNVTVTGGEVWNVFGGSEEKGDVTGTATVVIECGDDNIKGGVYGGGAGFGNTNPNVANVDIQMVSGYVSQIVGGGARFTNKSGDATTSSTTGNINISMEGGETQFIYDRVEDTAVTGNVNVAVTGGRIYNGGCVLGTGGTGTTGDVTISVAKDATFAEHTHIGINQPVDGALSIDLDGLYIPVHMQGNVLENTEQATLTYRNLGSVDGTWTQYTEDSALVKKGSNPYLELNTFGGNKFDEIVFENSYVDFRETGTSTDPKGFDTVTDKLTLDGGAMRVFFRINTQFPASEFKNNPLLYYGYHIKGGSYGTSVMEFTSATGTANVQLMARDGNAATDPLYGAEVSKNGLECVVAPMDTPDETFQLQNNAAMEEKCYWGTNTYGSGEGNNKLWQVVNQSSCSCPLGAATLEKTVFYMKEGEAASGTLNDVRALGQNQCKIVGHKTNSCMVSYALSNAQGTTAPDATITDDQLSVTGVGCIKVAVTAQRGLKSKTDEVSVYVVERPADAYRFNMSTDHPDYKDIVLVYKGTNLMRNEIINLSIKTESGGIAYLVYNNDYTATVDGDTLTLTIKKEYLAALGAVAQQEYKFEVRNYVNSDRFSILVHTVKIQVSDKNSAVVILTPDKTEGVVYGEEVSYQVSVAKANDADTEALTGTVQFQVDGNNYGEPLPMAAASVTIDHTKLTAGTHTITATYSGDINYAGDTDSATTTVGRAPIKVKAALDKANIYVGAALPTPNIVYEGLVDGDTLTPNTVATFSGMPADSNTVGSHTITWSNQGAMQTEIEALPTYANYTATYADTITLTIESRPSTGGSSGGGGTTTPPVVIESILPGTVNVILKPSVDKEGNAIVTISEKNIADAIKKAQDEAEKNGTEKNGIAVTITIDTKEARNAFALTLPNAGLEKLIAAGVTSLTIDGGATITFDLEAMKQMKAATNADVVVTATKIDDSTLSKEAQGAIGGRSVYDFKVTGGGKNITTFGNGKLSLSIPYTLQKVDENGKPSTNGSLESADNLRGVYIDEDGKVTYLADAHYTAASKAMLVRTTHLSTFGVAYKIDAPTQEIDAPTFTDIASHWAKNHIDFVAARGLLTGTRATTFSPDTSMTRGMFVTALGRLAEIDPNSYMTGSFTDVKTDAYYAPYVNWAVKNNIVTGTSATTFSPDRAITRQEMAVITANYAKAMGNKLPSVHKEIAFTDSASIDIWAKAAVKEIQMAGILMGRDDGKFDPMGTATRGEVSAVLRRFVELMENSEATTD